jgi:hypothetical protein
MAELQKKLVTKKRFWEILCKQSVLLGRANAIRPEIKAKRGRTRKFNLGLKANWGRIGEGVRLPNNNPKIGMPILLYSFEAFKATYDQKADIPGSYIFADSTEFSVGRIG